MNSDVVVLVLAAVLMAIGLAGTVLPILPGLWLMWAAALGYGLLTGFGTVGLVMFVAITLIVIVAMGLGFVLPQRGAAAAGIPIWGQWLAALAAVVGIFLVPVVGAPLGFVLGVLAAHIVSSRTLRGAPAATWTTLKSMALASGVQFLAGLLILAAWVVWVVV